MIGTVAASRDRALVSSMPAVAVAAHRLGGWYAGENSLASARVSMAEGIPVGECDFQYSSDGTAWVFHDATLDADTDGTGAISSKTDAQMATISLDYMNARYYATGYADQPLSTLADLVAASKRRMILLAEQKDAGTGTIAGEAAALKSAGMVDCLIIESGTLAVVEAWAAQGFHSMFITFTPYGSLAALASAGVDWIGYPGSGITGSDVTTAQAAGLKVAVWNLTEYEDAKAWITAGADMVMLSHPLGAVHYLSDSPTVDAGASLATAGGVWIPGAVAFLEESGLSLSSTGAKWTAAGAERSVRFDSAGPITATTFNVTGTVRYTGTTGTTDWGGVMCSGPYPYRYKATGNTGYHALLRKNGTLDFYRFTSASATKIGTMSTTGSLSADTDYEVRIAITPTGATATRVDTAESIVTSDTTYRPAKWWPNVNRGGSNAWIMRAVAVS